MSETEHKIRLRQIESEDLAQMRDWRNSPRVRKICREYRLLTMDDQVNWFDQLRGDTTLAMFAIEAGSAGVFIGVCGWTYIDWRSRHALLSMYIGKDEYDQEEWYLAVLWKLFEVAFADLGMISVRAEVYDFDPRKDVIEKAGFHYAGTWQWGYYHDAEPHDITLWELRVHDWNSGLGRSLDWRAKKRYGLPD